MSAHLVFCPGCIAHPHNNQLANFRCYYTELTISLVRIDYLCYAINHLGHHLFVMQLMQTELLDDM